MLGFSLNWLKKYCGKIKCGFCIQIMTVLTSLQTGWETPAAPPASRWRRQCASHLNPPKQFLLFFVKARRRNFVQGSNSCNMFSRSFLENDSLTALPAATGSADGRSVCCFAAIAAFIRSKGGSEAHWSTATVWQTPPPWHVILMLSLSPPPRGGTARQGPPGPAGRHWGPRWRSDPWWGRARRGTAASHSPPGSCRRWRERAWSWWHLCGFDVKVQENVNNRRNFLKYGRKKTRNSKFSLIFYTDLGTRDFLVCLEKKVTHANLNSSNCFRSFRWD